MLVELDESQRQQVLMALAHLAVERPGFDHALTQIALLMDKRIHGPAVGGGESEPTGQVFEDFKRLRRLSLEGAPT